MAPHTSQPDFTETPQLRLVSPSSLDTRTDDEIISLILTPRPIVSQKNIWAFWDTGFMQMRPYVRRNIIGWVRRLGKDWAVRVLDDVPGSPNNVKNVVDSSYFHSAFNNGTMAGEYTGAHKADLIRLPLLYLYGGIWIDAGTMLFRHVDEICWDVIEDTTTPYEIAGFGIEGDIILNGFIATQKGNLFIKKWHDVFLEIWKDQTDCIGLHAHPLVSDVEIELPQETCGAFGDDKARFNDYIAHFLAFKKVRFLQGSVNGDNFSGVEYWNKHAYVLPGSETVLHQFMLRFDGQQQLDLLQLPREGHAPEDRNQEAESLVNALLTRSSTMKISHGLKNGKIAFLGELWDLPENEDMDIKPGSFAAYLRWGSEHLQQTRVIKPVSLPN